MKMTRSVLTTCLVTLGMASAAYATNEVETNHPLANAQGLAQASSHTIVGAIGSAADLKTDDLDFYTFEAKEGDVIDITATAGQGTIKTIVVGIFLSNGKLDRLQPGTGTARVDKYVVEASGTYTVGVSSGSRYFISGGGTMAYFSSITDQVGDYSLNVSGISPSVKQIKIEVKPGSNELAPLNPRAKGKLPVAIFGAAGFDVNEIKQNTLTFGSTGTENSLSKCQPETRDINRDGYADLLCHFENSTAAFQSGDIEGVLKGSMDGNISFEGRSVLKVIPTVHK